MSQKRSGLFKAVSAVVAILVVVAGVAYFSNSGDHKTIPVVAEFKDAFPMQPGNVVKIAGVQVGTISAITLDHGLARVSMDVDPEVLPLHTDAKATITTESLLGERYVALDRGTPSAPLLGDPAVIRTPQTNRDVDLQEVLNAADTPTSVALAGLISTTGSGLRGNGGKAAAAISALQPALHQTDQLVGILNQQNAQLNHLVDDAAPVADAFAADQGRRLDSMVGSTTETLSVVAARQQALRDTLQQLPSSLASARRTLAQLAGTADPAANTLADIRPTTDNLKDISGELRDFADAADPALGSLPPVLDRAKDLFDQARPVAEQLRESGGNLRGTADGLHGLLGNFLDLRFTDLMEVLKGWSLATADYDSISHYFKAEVVTDPKSDGELVASPIPGMSSSPIPGGLPAPAPLEPRLDQLGKPITPPHSTERPKQGPNAGATGLTPNQEDSMMGQLLGGN